MLENGPTNRLEKDRFSAPCSSHFRSFFEVENRNRQPTRKSIDFDLHFDSNTEPKASQDLPRGPPRPTQGLPEAPKELPGASREPPGSLPDLPGSLPGPISGLPGPISRLRGLRKVNVSLQDSQNHKSTSLLARNGPKHKNMDIVSSY